MKDEQVQRLVRLAGDDLQPGPPSLEDMQFKAEALSKRRRLGLIAGASLVALGGVVGGFTLVHHNGPRGHETAADTLGPLTQAQYDLAVTAAQLEINEQHAHITEAHATLLTDKVDGNVAACPTPSLRVQLVGDFPSIVIGGGPASSGDGSNDRTVTSVLVTMDPVTGAFCQVGVSDGTPHVYPGAAELLAAVHSAS
jgi:hypothetical protein